MKTAIKFLAVALMLASLLSLTSCIDLSFLNKPELDLEAAEKNLEDDGYTVIYTGKSDVASEIIENLDPGVEETLYAKKGEAVFYMTVYENDAIAKAVYEQMKYSRESSEKRTKLEIKQIETMLKECEDLSSAEKNDYEDDLDDLEETLEEMKEVTIGRSGNVIWYGSKEVIADTKAD